MLLLLLKDRVGDFDMRGASFQVSRVLLLRQEEGVRVQSRPGERC
jgi:hypothetical protein